MLVGGANSGSNTTGMAVSRCAESLTSDFCCREAKQTGSRRQTSPTSLRWAADRQAGCWSAGVYCILYSSARSMLGLDMLWTALDRAHCCVCEAAPEMLDRKGRDGGGTCLRLNLPVPHDSSPSAEPPRLAWCGTSANQKNEFMD
jgi:hypothetical protein